MFITQELIKCTVEYFIDEPGCQRDQYQVGARLLPFVSIVMRQSTDQPTVQFFGNPGWKRFAPCEVLLNTWRQCRAWAPIVSIAAHNTENATVINARAMIPIATIGMFTFVSMSTTS